MNILELKKDDKNIDKVIDTLVCAFKDNEVYVFFIDKPLDRLAFVKKFMKFRLNYGLKHGRVFVTPDYKGVAIWTNPGHKMSPVDLLLCGGMTAMLSCKSDERKRLMEFNNFSDEAMKIYEGLPYSTLSPIGVAPDFQGKGYSRALVEKSMELMKNEGKDIKFVLETQSDKNCEIYKKLGFKTDSVSEFSSGNFPHYLMSI